jgi:hypothetical protein
MEEEEEMLAAAVQAEKGGAAGAAVLGSRVKPSMALALVNIRNRCVGLCAGGGGGLAGTLF